MSNKFFEAELNEFSGAIKYWVRSRVLSIRYKSMTNSNDIHAENVSKGLLPEFRRYLKVKFRKLLLKFRSLF